MDRMDEEFAVLLEDIPGIEADMAKNLLQEAGIPCLLHGQDFDVAELGHAAHSAVRGRTVLVPKTALERARSLLEQAWGPKDEDG